MAPQDEHSTDSAENKTEPNGVVGAGQRQQGKRGEQPAGSSPSMLPGLQEQITQALQPLMGSLRQQVAQVISQEQSTAGGSQPAAGADSTQSAPQGESGPSGTGNLLGTLQNVFVQVRTAIQKAVEWIVRMARAVFAAVRAWLQKISAALSKLAVSLAMSGAKRAARPVMKAVVNKSVDALEQRSKQTLKSVLGGAKPAAA